jgi:spermidine synthase
VSGTSERIPDSSATHDSRRLLTLVFVLFLVSGACGLIYEIAWSRILHHVFGTTVLAVGTVLAAFMCGLAAGSYLLGRIADRTENPLRLYAFYELGVGITGVIVLFLLDALPDFYSWLHGLLGGSFTLLAIVRFIVAFTLMMVPTLLMGATLPILSKFVVRNIRRLGSDLAALYAINTLGAVCGTLLAGFWLIGWLGIHGTVYVAAAGNLAVGVVAFIAASSRALSRVHKSSQPDASGPAAGDSVSAGRDAVDRRTMRLLLWAFALSGFASFAYEIFWTRSLVFLLGNSTYAFTLMLTAFLSGIAIGGYAVRLFVDRIESPLRLFGWTQVLIGITSGLALPVLFVVVHSEAVRQFLLERARTLETLALSNFLISLAVMLVPATLIGATFPLVGRIYVVDLGQTGTDTGRIYAVNTIGNVAGALLPGLVLLPLLGIQRGIVAVASLNLCLGAAILFASQRRPVLKRAAIPGLLVVLALVGPLLPVEFQFPSEYQKEFHEVLFYEEGVSATTKVFLDPGTREKIMSVDGIAIGGTGATNYKQVLLAHLPKLLLPAYESELSVGLGSGILVGESALHGRLQRIVCLEIEPSVVRGAAYFDEENHGVLTDRRLALVVDDVGHYLRTTEELFDIVSADEKTAENYASNGFSYSADYYSLLLEHLEPGGLVAQWVPGDLPPDQFRMVIRTFADVFPHVQLWYFPPAGKVAGSNLVMIGSRVAVSIDHDRIERALASDDSAFDAMRRYGFRSAASLLSHFIAEDDAVRRAVAEAPLNSLEYPRYEFYSPSDYAVQPGRRSAANLDLLLGLRGQQPDERTPAELDAAERELIEQAFRAEGHFLSGFRLQLLEGAVTQVEEHYAEALRETPWNRNLRQQILPFYWTLAGFMFLDGEFAESLTMMERAVDIYGDDGEVRYYYGLLLERNGRIEEAIEQYELALALRPELNNARAALAALKGRTQR